VWYNKGDQKSVWEVDFKMTLMDNNLMVQVTVDEVQRDLPAYLQRVEAGETLIIVKAGRPMAEIKPVAPIPNTLRPFGLCAGEFTVPDDFDDPLPDHIIKEFEER
jgi:prevent-host-death family protein